MTNSSWASTGSILMFLAVAAGAFGAHGLKSKISADMLAVFEVGIRYQVYHALALFVVAWLASQTVDTRGHALVTTAGWLFLAGIAIFSGSLYALSFSGLRWLGAITPFGGLCFLAGWAVLVFAAKSALR